MLRNMRQPVHCGCFVFDSIRLGCAQVDGEIVVVVVGASARLPQQVAVLRAASPQLLLETGPADWQVLRSAAETQVRLQRPHYCARCKA
jgi:hypothetical protein